MCVLSCVCPCVVVVVGGGFFFTKTFMFSLAISYQNSFVSSVSVLSFQILTEQRILLPKHRPGLGNFYGNFIFFIIFISRYIYYFVFQFLNIRG